MDMSSARLSRRQIVAALSATALLGACSPVAPGPATPSSAKAPGAVQEPLTPLISTPELVTGENRFAFGLQQGARLLEGERVSVGVFELNGALATLKARYPAPYLPLEIVEGNSRTHVHPDGQAHSHDAAGSPRGIYVSQVQFDKPGTWGIEVVREANGSPADSARLQVSVLATAPSPAVGTPAPKSRNLIATDVADLAAIDSSDPPDPRLHQVRIADAIDQGRPLLIAFATPRYCTSRVCGPVLDVVRSLLPAYGDRVAFVHQEIWEDFAAQRHYATVQEWNLQSEPWVFLVDGKGTIRAKFAGIATGRELSSALDSLLAR